MKRDWVRKQKEDKLLEDFDNPLSKYPKEFIKCIGCISRYLSKPSSGLEVVSGAHFLHIFP